MTRVIDTTKKPRIVIADDMGLIFSDDWRRGWLNGFKNLGCHVSVVDISPLRRLMAGGPYSVRGSGAAAAAADQITSLKPDLVWCHHGRAAGHEFFLSKLRKRGVPTAVYLCDEPYEAGETARYSTRFDYVFSMDWCTVEAHKNARPFSKRGTVFYLPPCVDESLFAYRPYNEKRQIPAFFLGNPTLIPREQWLRHVEKTIPGADIRFWPQKGRPVAKGHKDWISAEDHPKFYGGCKVGLNVHRHPGITKECFQTRVLRRPRQMPIPEGCQLAQKMPAQEGTGFWNDFDLPASHLNPRAFEFFASGTLVVSDDTRSELDRMFPCAPRAGTPEAFSALVRYYLDHLDEAEEIGRVCSYLVSKRHTYRHRVYEALTRIGLEGLLPRPLPSSLAEPEDFLTPQDFALLKAISPSEQTGPSESWSPQSGLLWTRTCGDSRRALSINAVPPVLPWPTGESSAAASSQ
jgi:spore maturation protein CgeB